MARVNYDILVHDDNITDLVELNMRLAEKFESKLGDYLVSLRRISEEGFVDGLVAENIREFYTQVSLLREEVQSTAEMENEELAEFVKSIDIADSVLY